MNICGMSWKLLGSTLQILNVNLTFINYDNNTCSYKQQYEIISICARSSSSFVVLRID